MLAVRRLEELLAGSRQRSVVVQDVPVLLQRFDQHQDTEVLRYAKCDRPSGLQTPSSYTVRASQRKKRTAMRTAMRAVAPRMTQSIQMVSSPLPRVMTSRRASTK